MINVPNPNYFPTLAPRSGFTNENDDKIIASYENFKNFIDEDPALHDFLNSTKKSSLLEALAFLFEANKQLNPNDWEEKIDDLKSKIKTVRAANADQPIDASKETTWVLNNSVTNLYQASIAMKILDAKVHRNITEAKFLTQVLENLESTKNLKNSMEIRNKAVTIGGINQTFVPAWYKSNFESASDKPPNN